MKERVWSPAKATEEQRKAARFLAEHLRPHFDPKRHGTIWAPELSRLLQSAWHALAEADFDLYCAVRAQDIAGTQALANALLCGGHLQMVQDKQPRLF